MDQRSWSAFIVVAIASLTLAIVLGMTACLHGEGLPPQPDPIGGPATLAEIELGRFMFYNPVLSTDGTVSCATCHDPKRGWGDGMSQAVGIGGQIGTRKSPTLINVAYLGTRKVFWDGRTDGISAQALLPISNPIEMGQQTEGQAIARLNLDKDVVERFVRVFGIDRQTQRAVTGGRLARVLVCFQTTIVSADAPVDRYREGDKDALTADARLGYAIFEKSGCMNCHVPPLYTDQRFHNNGAEFVCKTRITDEGKFRVTGKSADVRSFKTPTLREIARRNPYMHHGLMPDIDRVIAHYNSGGKNNRGLADRFMDPQIKPLGLSETEAGYLKRFMLEGFVGWAYPDISAP